MGQAVGQQASEGRERQLPVFAAQVELLYSKANVGFLVTAIASSVLVAVLWQVVDRPLLWGWFAAILLVTLGRVILVVRYHSDGPGLGEARIWARRFLVGAGLTGVCWGLAAALLLPTHHLPHQFFVLMLVAAIAAGGAPLMSAVQSVYLAFVLPILLLGTARLMLEPSFAHATLGVMALVYLGALIAISRLVNATISDSLRLRYENLDLIEDLSTSKRQLEHINRQLKREIVQRERAQQRLIQARNTLEERVERRTKELTESNHSLAAEIAERKRVEQALFEQKERAEVTLHSIGDGVITTDRLGRIGYMNPVAEALTGWSSDEARTRPSAEILLLINEETRQPLPDPVMEALTGERVVSLSRHSVLIGRAGDGIGMEITVAPIQDHSDQVVGVVIVLHDVSEERQLKRQLAYQAMHDALTGLKNRRAFEERLDALLTTSRSEGLHHAMLYLDLDQFKIINDTCGHVAGDALLRQLTAMLHERMRETDLIARLGGDEFGILLERCPVARARDVANAMLETIKAFRFSWEGKYFELSASIGLVAITPEADSPSQLMSAADIACYAAKDLGRDRVHVYTENDTELRARHREMNWVTRIKSAISDDRIVLYQQPIVPVSDTHSRASQYEVLMRIRDETGELIPPGAFIPAAERYDLMPLLDRRVISKLFESYRLQRTACKPGSSWPTYWINLSGASLTDDKMLAFITEELQRAQIPGGTIGFEVTETSAVANLAGAALFMSELQALGCRFSLDDFGSGMSSFNYLKMLPVDCLKIDGAFVQDVDRDRTNRALVEAINRIGHVMGYYTVAECVDTTRTRERLKEIGVDYMQGFEVGAPYPMPEQGGTTESVDTLH